jgi:hypothetical protein
MCGHSVAFQKVDQALLRDEHCSSEFEKVDYTLLSIKTCTEQVDARFAEMTIEFLELRLIFR